MGRGKSTGGYSEETIQDDCVRRNRIFTPSNILYGKTERGQTYSMRKPLNLDEFKSLKDEEGFEQELEDSIPDAKNQISSFFEPDLVAYFTYLQTIYPPGSAVTMSDKQGTLVNHKLVTRGIKYNLQSTVSWVIRWKDGVEETLYDSEAVTVYSKQH